jgi:hypothetical protein
MTLTHIYIYDLNTHIHDLNTHIHDLNPHIHDPLVQALT